MAQRPVIAVMAGLLATALSGAEPPAKDPTAPDPVTVRRANAAADAYAREIEQQNLRPDPEAEAIVAEVEVLLIETKAYLKLGADEKARAKAGDTFLAASEKLRKIPGEQQHALGKRYRDARDQLAVLAGQLISDTSLKPEPSPPATATPEAPPPSK